MPRWFPTVDQIMEMKWYVQPNDEIGGWCVTFEDKLPSKGAHLVGDFLTKELAEHMVLLHNTWLGWLKNGGAPLAHPSDNSERGEG